jgi:NAD(P)-dependent dehydrogenase (short-subunit alcohol dehydrogenase family)
LHRFDGRVAVVTGAGRGIGRAYALLLAELGASVVVNDVGVSVDGRGADAGPAEQVVRSIQQAGGAARASTGDVASVDGADAAIATAIDAFGRIDAVVNNAGIMRWAGPPDVDLANLEAHLAVHTIGSFNTVKAAWPHMQAQGYGRIVMTTSTGLFGMANNTSYATAKAALIGLTRSLAVAGAGHDIKANLIAPAATTRMAGSDSGPDSGPDSGSASGAGFAGMEPELVAPMAAFLSHEACPVTGEIYTAGAGRFARLFIGSTRGYVHPGPGVTVDDVAGHWDTINDEAGYWVPADLMSWSAAFTEHLRAGD